MSATGRADGTHGRRVAVLASLACDLSPVILWHFEQTPMACQSTRRKGMTGGYGPAAVFGQILSQPRG